MYFELPASHRSGAGMSESRRPEILFHLEQNIECLQGHSRLSNSVRFTNRKFEGTDVFAKHFPPLIIADIWLAKEICGLQDEYRKMNIRIEVM